MTDNTPRKQIRLEVEVPGTPEQVWDAIATGPGVSSWFAPAEVDERVGGRYVTVHGDGEEMRATETISAYEPPHRLVVEASEEDYGPALATEWLVEAQSGGTCIVRLVSTVVGTEEWADYVDSMDQGWRGYLANLELYLMHFAGKHARTLLTSGADPSPTAEAYPKLMSALGFGDTPPAVGDTVTTSGDAPPLEAVVEVDRGTYSILRTTSPHPGLAIFGAYCVSDNTLIVLHQYVFDEAADIDRIEADWRTWADEHFPAEVSAA